MANCPNHDVNSQQCPCTSADCERHAICCECMAAHAKRGSPAACTKNPRPESTKSLPIGLHTDCPNRARNEAACPCTETSCPRHGICCDCVRFHWGHPAWPKTACMA